MPPHDLVGQGIMFRFHGSVFTDEAREAFRQIRPGGILFFADNITSREQVYALTYELQAEARELGMPPLLVAADQEGGIVSRFSRDFITMPGPMALAASGNRTDIETAAFITGSQLREVGINVNFAPSVDVNNNPDNPVIRTRSFGDTAEAVSDCAGYVFRGHERARVMTTVKHFPGHGDTAVDSHLGLPVIPYDRERIDAVELAPFRAAIAHGVPAVMSTHILFSALDEVLPATLSPAILTGLLRRQMGFSGLIFTDSMSMNAISGAYGVGESTVLAKLAGVDVVESNDPLHDLLERHGTLLAALESGRIPASAFQETADRVDDVRERYQITGEPTELPKPPRDRADTAFEIALRTIDHGGPKPFAPVPPDASTVFIDFQRFRTTEAEDPVGRAGVLRDAIAEHLPGAVIATLSNDPTEDEIKQAIDSAGAASTLIILTRDASDLPRQAEIAQHVIASARDSARMIHCAMRGPYDAGRLANVDDFLFAFGDPAISIRALLAVLAGAPPTAILPVNIPTMPRS